jgi:hypothetical protein
MQSRPSSRLRFRLNGAHADSAAIRALAVLVLFASDDAIGHTLAALGDLGDEEAGGLLAALLPDDDREGGA